LGSEAAGEVSHGYLQRRRCPVLAFYASPGIDTDFSATSAEARVAAEVAVTKYPASRVVLWKGTGHWLQQERFAEFNHLALAWISEVVIHR
jgi:pimeloyl-ACP methyl ester carboxylesterase